MATQNPSFTFFVVSDPHLTYPAESAERLSEDAISVFRDTLSQIVTTGADLVFFTGDILESRKYGLLNLEIAFDLMDSLTIPWFVLVGNHDLRYRATLDAYDKDCFIAKFKGHGPDGSVAYWRHDCPENEVAFIGIDSTIPGSGHGMIEEEQKEWLNNTLAEIDRDRSVVVLTHHPFILFDDEIRDIEKMNIYLLKNHNEIRTVVEKHNNVILVISGHNHTCRYLHINGIHYVGCPSINIWPTMYTKFTIDRRRLTFTHIPIKDSAMTDKSRKKIFCDNSSIVEIFGNKEAAYEYYSKGPRSAIVEL